MLLFTTKGKRLGRARFNLMERRGGGGTASKPLRNGIRKKKEEKKPPRGGGKRGGSPLLECGFGKKGKKGVPFYVLYEGGET